MLTRHITAHRKVWSVLAILLPALLALAWVLYPAAPASEPRKLSSMERLFA